MARIEKEYEIKTTPERIRGLLTLDLIAILLVSMVAPLFVLISTAPTSSSLSHLFNLPLFVWIISAVILIVSIIFIKQKRMVVGGSLISIVLAGLI